MTAIQGTGDGYMNMKRRGIVHLVYTVVVLAFLLLCWEFYARSITHTNLAGGYQATTGPVYRNPSNNNELQKFLLAVPLTRAPRVMILGSSQVAVIKDSDRRSQSVPTVLQKALKDRIGSCEVVDLSAGGQSTVESMVVLIESMEALRPNVVVLGVSLYSMQSTEVRATLLESLSLNELLKHVTGNLPPEVRPEVSQSLTSFRTIAEKRHQAKGETIQQRIDNVIARQTERVSCAATNRQAMYNLLLDAPLRRDLVVYVKRHIQSIQVARTYDIGAYYAPSMVAIEVMSSFCKKRHVPLMIVVLPYDSTIKPVPYRAVDQAKMVSDFSAVAIREGLVVADLSHLLGHECFGLFEDGSPDGLHYRSTGHVIVGRTIADILAENVLGRRSISSANSESR
jgi:hypothetical protein